MPFISCLSAGVTFIERRDSTAWVILFRCAAKGLTQSTLADQRVSDWLCNETPTTDFNNSQRWGQELKILYTFWSMDINFSPSSLDAAALTPHKFRLCAPQGEYMANGFCSIMRA